MKTGYYYFIECISEKREKLLKPSLIITKIFEAQKIKLDETYRKILNKKVRKNKKNFILADEIFEKIEYYFNYEIHFKYPTYSDEIKLYCSK